MIVAYKLSFWKISDPVGENGYDVSKVHVALGLDIGRILEENFGLESLWFVFL